MTVHPRRFDRFGSRHTLRRTVTRICHSICHRRTKKEVRPMTRNMDTESHRRMAAEQELKVAEKPGEHQVKIGTKTEVEKQKAAELRKPGADCQEIA